MKKNLIHTIPHQNNGDQERLGMWEDIIEKQYLLFPEFFSRQDIENFKESLSLYHRANISESVYSPYALLVPTWLHLQEMIESSFFDYFFSREIKREHVKTLRHQHGTRKKPYGIVDLVYHRKPLPFGRYERISKKPSLYRRALNLYEIMAIEYMHARGAIPMPPWWTGVRTIRIGITGTQPTVFVHANIMTEHNEKKTFYPRGVIISTDML